MRAAVGSLACLAALVPLAFAAPETAPPPPTYHLHGYYHLYNRMATWQFSDGSPWQVVKDDPWIDPMVVKWGYVPMTHNSKHYYCLIDDRPRTGSNIIEKTFVCGDPEVVELVFRNNWKPILAQYGGR